MDLCMHSVIFRSWYRYTFKSPIFQSGSAILCPHLSVYESFSCIKSFFWIWIFRIKKFPLYKKLLLNLNLVVFKEYFMNASILNCTYTHAHIYTYICIHTLLCICQAWSYFCTTVHSDDRLYFFLMLIYFLERERERASMHEWGEEREGDRGS